MATAESIGFSWYIRHLYVARLMKCLNEHLVLFFCLLRDGQTMPPIYEMGERLITIKLKRKQPRGLNEVSEANGMKNSKVEGRSERSELPLEVIRKNLRKGKE